MRRNVLNADEDLQITVSKRNESSIVRLRGRLNVDSSPALRDRLLSMLEAQSPKGVVVDFTDVSYVDSSGIATLIEALRIARLGQATLCVQGLEGRLLHLFQVTGISALFEKSGCGSVSTVSQVS